MQNPISTALGTVQNIEDLVRVHTQHGVVTADSDAYVVEPNAMLALNVAELVPIYARRCGTTNDEIASVLSDLVSDLRHLADAIGIEWDELDERAADHYAAEVAR